MYSSQSAVNQQSISSQSAVNQSAVISSQSAVNQQSISTQLAVNQHRTQSAVNQHSIITAVNQQSISIAVNQYQSQSVPEAAVDSCAKVERVIALSSLRREGMHVWEIVADIWRLNTASGAYTFPAI